MQIRTSSPADFPAVLRLWRESAAFPTLTDDLEGLAALHARDTGALIVAEDEGRVLGTVIAAWDGWRGGIYRLVVAESHRRRGLARQLVGAALASLEARGVRRVAAVVDGDDLRAMAFWQAMSTEGFACNPTRTRFTRTIRTPD